jgi:hypothetical protein
LGDLRRLGLNWDGIKQRLVFNLGFLRLELIEQGLEAVGNRLKSNLIIKLAQLATDVSLKPGFDRGSRRIIVAMGIHVEAAFLLFSFDWMCAADHACIFARVRKIRIGSATPVPTKSSEKTPKGRLPGNQSRECAFERQISQR